jgi:cobalt/nickel transport system permease protein
VKRVVSAARALTLLAVLLLWGAPEVHAMHVSEGILPWGWAVFWYCASAPFVAWGLYRLKGLSGKDLAFKPLAGLITALVFIISCVPIPVPVVGSTSHPCGTAMSAILLGPGVSVIVAACALFIQALFLSHGGLSTLGANVFSMGVMGSFTGYAAFRFLRGLKVNLVVSAFVAGICADWATYLATSVELSSGIRGDAPFFPLFLKIMAAFMPTQLPLGILEGAMTAGMISLLLKRKPDLLVRMRLLKPGEVTP